MVRQDRKVGQPGPDLVPILFGQDSGHLSNVTEIVNDPCRQ